MNNLRFIVQDSQRHPRAKRSPQTVWWGHSQRWSRLAWRLTTVVCKCCCVKDALEGNPVVYSVFRKDKKQGRTYVFKCQQCKLRWIGKMPAGAELTNVYKYEDGQIVQWTRGEKSKAVESNKPNLAGDGHGWPCLDEKETNDVSTSQV